MATFSKKMMGKEVGSASTYAKPHTMDGKPLKAAKVVDPNTLSAKSVNPYTPAMRVSAGDPGADDVKTSGIKMRGTGCATKGLMSRGPMA
jgi:hypothetical protein